VIYLIDCVGTNYFKVGYSEDLFTLEKRVRGIQSSNPFEIKVLQLYETLTYEDEVDFHWEYRHTTSHARGEWYLKNSRYRRSWKWAHHWLVDRERYNAREKIKRIRIQQQQEKRFPESKHCLYCFSPITKGREDRIYCDPSCGGLYRRYGPKKRRIDRVIVSAYDSINSSRN
jgi:hypothetical protein